MKRKTGPHERELSRLRQLEWRKEWEEWIASRTPEQVRHQELEKEIEEEYNKVMNSDWSNRERLGEIRDRYMVVTRWLQDNTELPPREPEGTEDHRYLGRPSKYGG